MILAHRLHRIANLSRHEWRDLLLAAWDLAIVAVALSARTAMQIRREDLITAKRQTALSSIAEQHVARAQWAIACASQVVPWRSDCLRQAEAGRRWLKRRGVTAELRLGARRNPGGALEMHAWLIAGDKVVTGGDIVPFTPFC